jgi:hypothetical protein
VLTNITLASINYNTYEETRNKNLKIPVNGWDLYNGSNQEGKKATREVCVD